MPSESRWRIYRRDPPRMGVHCRGCLRGFASRSMRLLSPPFPCSLQFRRRSGKGCVTKPNFVPISNPILPLNSNLSDIGIKLIAAYFTRGNFTEFRWKFHFFSFIGFRFEKLSFRIENLSNLSHFFLFFGNLSAFREFFTKFPWYFWIEFGQKIGQQCAQTSFSRDWIAGLVDFSSDRQPRVDGTRKRGNERVDQMTSSRQREGPPAKGVHGGRGGGRGLVAGTIVAVPRGGSSRLNGPSPWEASRRPFSLYNFNSRVDDFASRSERANTRSLSFLSFPSPFSLSLLFFFFFCFCNQGSRKQLPLKATWLF